MTYPFSTLLLAAAIPAVSFFLWKWYAKKSEFSAGTSRWALLFLLILTLLLRLLYLNETEGNMDASTWLSYVLAIEHYPDTLWTLLNYTDSRPLTVLPLFIGSKLGLGPSYSAAQVVGILLWLGSLYFFYLTVSLFESRAFALHGTWVVGLFIGATGVGDYVSYNSEHISVLMLTVTSYWYLLGEKRQYLGKGKAFVLGLLLGSLLFAKFQNVPMGLTIGAFGLYSLGSRKAWAPFVLLLLGGLLPTLLVNGYYALHGELSTFWNYYFWNYFYYSYTTEFSTVSMLDRFSPLRNGLFIFKSPYHGLYFLTLLGVLLLAGIASFRYRSAGISRFQRINGIFASIFLSVSLYAVMQSGNKFTHYLLYLLIPFTYLVVYILSNVMQPIRLYLLGLLVLGATVQGSYNIIKRKAEDPPLYTLDKKVVEYIRKNSTPSDKIIIWGWDDHLYIRSGRPPGYRYTSTGKLFVQSTLLEQRKQHFLNDLRTNKPSLFLDTVTPFREPPFEHLFKPHESIPEVAKYIEHHYCLINRINGARIYKRII
jgi:hypothetical protein